LQACKGHEVIGPAGRGGGVVGSNKAPTVASADRRPLTFTGSARILADQKV